ncbi:MAG: GNAT family N-acetyltransferase [Pseudomonadota bacterium]
MSREPAGSAVEYQVTYLQMDARPSYDYPTQPAHLKGAALQRAEAPPAWYFFNLYDAVGSNYEWVDMHAKSSAEITEWLHAPGMALYTLLGQGWPKGFFLLDGREDTTVDLAYFGLVPEAVGQGFGTWFLRTAILMAWDRPGTQSVTVNTCTLDHPRALAHYQKQGFVPQRQETRTRILTRDQSVAST